MKKIETVAIAGLGAIGSFFADRLLPVLGDGVRVVADGERAERIKANGVTVNGKQEFFNVVSPAEKAGFADLAIVITKASGLEQALKDVKNQIGPETLIIAPLNGVESEEKVAEAYGEARVVYSLMRVSSVRNGSSVKFDPNNARVEFGEAHNDLDNLSDRVKIIKELFEKAEIKCIIPVDMLRAKWEKFVCNVSENQVAAVLDIPFGAWKSCPDANELRIAVAAEAIEIARKMGIMIDLDYARNHLEYLCTVPEGNKSSTVQDILAGRKTEKDIFAGAVIRYGKKTGVSTPLNEFLYRAIAVLEAKNDGTVAGVEVK